MSVPDLTSNERSKGMAPIVLAAISIAANIRRYRQKLFFPVKVDSRWFIVEKLFKILSWSSWDNQLSNEVQRSHVCSAPFL
jgi:hypothetical protein